MALWTPANLAKPPDLLWIDASALAAGALTTAQIDKSTGGHNLVPAASPNNPRCEAAVIGGLNAVHYYWDGSNRSWALASYPTPITGSSLAAFQVQKVGPGVTYYGRMLAIGNDYQQDYDNTACINVYRDTGKNQFAVGFNSLGSGAAPFNTTNPGLYGIIIDPNPSGPSFNIWENGTNYGGLTSVPSFNAGTIAYGTSTQGAHQDYCEYWVGEQIVLGYVPTTAERQQIEGYLAWKWDGGVAGYLVGQLPAGHPYKTAAPQTGGGGGQTITLPGAAGAFALTGRTSLRAITRANAAGAFALTGRTSSASRTKVLPGSAGTFTLTGNTSLRAVTRANAASAYGVTGRSSSRTVNRGAAAGSYALTGRASSITRAVNLSGSAGSFTLTGLPGARNFSRTLPNAAGVYTLTGGTSSAARSGRLSGATGFYTLTGRASARSLSRTLSGAAGAYSLSGGASTLSKVHSGTLVSGPGSYALTGQPATRTLSRAVPGAAGAYVFTGRTSNATRSQGLSGAPGAYTLTGWPSGVRRSQTLPGAAGAYALTGRPSAQTKAAYRIGAAGVYSLIGRPSSRTLQKGLANASASFTITGYLGAVNKAVAKLVYGAAGSFVLTGRSSAVIQVRGFYGTTGHYGITGGAGGVRQAFAWHQVAPPTENWQAVTPPAHDPWHPVTDLWQDN